MQLYKSLGNVSEKNGNEEVAILRTEVLERISCILKKTEEKQRQKRCGCQGQLLLTFTHNNINCKSCQLV